MEMMQQQNIKIVEYSKTNHSEITYYSSNKS